MQNIKMRVTGGKYVRRNITYSLDLKDIRPSKDITRQGLFNALRGDLKDKTILDLFAGTGALGIEALSRGAKEATFVDLSRKAVELIKANTSYVEENINVLMLDYKSFLSTCRPQSYEVLFLDPPYHLDAVKILNEVIDAQIMVKNAIIIVETDKPLALTMENAKIKTYKYGITHVTIIWRTL